MMSTLGGGDRDRGCGGRARCGTRLGAEARGKGDVQELHARQTPGAIRTAGHYTDKDENGIPMEKPTQFEGKTLADVDDSELADIVRERNEAASSARRASAARRPARARCIGTSTTTRRTAARGSSSIRRTERFRR